MPAGKGVVSGGIAPCQGIILPDSPRYAAGTVTVLSGRVTWRRLDQASSVAVLPRTVVAHVTLATNGTYQFVLDPGWYVLQAHYLPPAGVAPYVTVRVRSGTTSNIDIPNECM